MLSMIRGVNVAVDKVTRSEDASKLVALALELGFDAHAALKEDGARVVMGLNSDAPEQLSTVISKLFVLLDATREEPLEDLINAVTRQARELARPPATS